MGNVSSQQMKDNIKLLNEQVFQAVNNTVNNNQSNCTSTQAVQTYFGVIPTGQADGQTTFTQCVPQAVFQGIDTTQTSTASCQITSTTATQVQTNFVSQVQSAIDQVAQQAEDQSADWLSSAANVGFQNVKTMQDVANIFKTSIDSNVLNTCVSTAINNQNIQQIYCGIYFGDINIDQNSTVASIADCASQSVLDALASSSQLTSLVQQTDEKLSQRTLGLVALLSQYKWIILGAILLIVVIFVIFLFILLRPRHASATVPAVSGVTTPVTPATPTTGNAQQQLVNTLLANPQLLALI